MKKQSDVSPLQVSQYNLLRDQLPDTLSSYMADGLHSLSYSLQDEMPKYVSTLAVHSPKSWKHRTSFLDFYAFGEIRDRYRALVGLARALAPFFLQTDILPLVQPLTMKDWRQQVEHDGHVFRALSTRGIIVYSINENQP